MIKIVTVYNTLNPGSLLQAISLYEKLDEKYGDVSFFKANIRHPYISGIKLFFKLLMKLKIKLAFQQLFMPMQYNRILKKYKKTKKINKEDIFVLGSDEIWNISRKDMAKHTILWGEGLNKKRCLSYAPSINNSKKDDFMKYNFVKDSLENFYSISCRDNNSKEVLSDLSNREINLVCDPTMLIDISKFKERQTEIKEEKYILVYRTRKVFF